VPALNVGCSGFATLHANFARDALEKLVGHHTWFQPGRGQAARCREAVREGAEG
jgi:Flp pilus assembly CpaF family ATPase